jgi:hypothetical protein
MQNLLVAWSYYKRFNFHDLINQRHGFLHRAYLRTRFTKTSNKKAASQLHRRVTRLYELEEENFDYYAWTIQRKKYFDYFIFNIVNFGLPCSGARRRALAQTISNACGLDINSSLSAEIHAQDLRLHRHQQRGDPNSARGLDNNFASDRDCDSTITTRLRHRRLRRTDHAAPDKS